MSKVSKIKDFYNKYGSLSGRFLGVFVLFYMLVFPYKENMLLSFIVLSNFIKDKNNVNSFICWVILGILLLNLVPYYQKTNGIPNIIETIKSIKHYPIEDNFTVSKNTPEIIYQNKNK